MDGAIYQTDCSRPGIALLAPADTQDGENIVPAPADAPQAIPALPVSLAREIERLSSLESNPVQHPAL